MKKLFFERAQESRGELPTTFVYDSVTAKVRNQVILITRGFLHNNSQRIVDKIKKKTGIFTLAEVTPNISNTFNHPYSEELARFFLEEKNIDLVLTVIEEICHILPDAILEEIDCALRRAGIGWKYSIEAKELMRIEDETFYNEVTKNCLSVLSKKGYEKTMEHFLHAYEELKIKNYADALTSCRRALESIIKTRLKQNNLLENEHSNLSFLLPIFNKNISRFSFLEDYFNNLCKLTEGVATSANKEGGHGKFEGSIDNKDEVFVRFIINQTASNVLFLAEVEFKK